MQDQNSVGLDIDSLLKKSNPLCKYKLRLAGSSKGSMAKPSCVNTEDTVNINSERVLRWGVWGTNLCKSRVSNTFLKCQTCVGYKERLRSECNQQKQKTGQSESLALVFGPHIEISRAVSHLSTRALCPDPDLHHCAIEAPMEERLQLASHCVATSNTAK